MTEPDRGRGDRRGARAGPDLDRRVRARSAGVRARGPAGRQPSRRALTLLELLLGITIVAALAGLVFATLTPLRDAARARSAADRIATFVRDVRDLALRSGEPVVIVLDPVAGRLTAEWLLAPPEERRATGVRSEADPLVDPGLLDELDGAAPAPATAGASGGLDDASDRREVAEPWSRLALADGVRLSPLPPDVVELGGDAGSGLDDPLGTAAPAAGPDARDAGLAESLAGAVEDLFDDAGPVRLLVVMPDGTTLLARPAWLRGPDGSVLRLDVHPWTGEPTWTDLGRAESDLEPAAGAEDVESLADDAAAPAPDGPGGGRRGTGR